MSEGVSHDEFVQFLCGQTTKRDCVERREDADVDTDRERKRDNRRQRERRGSTQRSASAACLLTSWRFAQKRLPSASRGVPSEDRS
jgi:hypothetical protein